MKRKLPRPGELVTNEDVASYALAAHKPCNGTGFTRLDLEQLCDCARERFLDMNIFRIWPDTEFDALRWGPNPPSADELREAARRSGGEMTQFTQLVTEDMKNGRS